MTASAEPADAPPRPRKKKKRKAAADAPPIPAFAVHFPRDPELDALVAAFEAGEYARVRVEAPALAKRTKSDEVRRAARELRRRLDPDPLAVGLMGIAAALLVALAAWYWTHPHAGDAAAPAATVELPTRAPAPAASP